VTDRSERFEVRFADETRTELRKLGPSAAAEVLRAIAKKLVVDPEQYGSPLRRDLAGYFKLAVRQWRVVYHVDATARRVLVLVVGKRALGDREDVYRGLDREELGARRKRAQDP